MGNLTIAGLCLAAAATAAAAAAMAKTRGLKTLAVCVATVATIMAVMYATGRRPGEPAQATYPAGVPLAEIESFCAEQHDPRDYRGRAECIGGQINGYLWLLQHREAARASR